MRVLQQQQPDDSNGDPRPPAVIKVEMPNSSERLNLNIRTLLTVADHLRSYVADPGINANDTDIIYVTAKAREAAEETFIGACAQLNLLINERTNFDVNLSDKIIDKHMADINRFNVDTAERRNAVARHQSRPSVMLGCRVKRKGDQLYAFLPGGNEETQTIWAMGNTLNEALDNLDKQLS